MLLLELCKVFVAQNNGPSIQAVVEVRWQVNTKCH